MGRWSKARVGNKRERESRGRGADGSRKDYYGNELGKVGRTIRESI